jgi:formylglycine-generating enzyme required for sulfatase activity/tRNA A-37 threonylcarbamoyl transferase component Bud32
MADHTTPPPAEQTNNDGGTPPPDGLSGRELTMQTPSAGSDLSGRELTMQTPAGGSPASLSGRELTMQTPSAGSDLSGRELTMQTPSAGSDLSGRELTMQTPTAGAGLSGRELTMQSPTTPAPLSGRELTMQPAAGGATPTPATMGGRPKTGYIGRPKTGSGTSVGFDDAWHLQGRKGPHTGVTWGDFELGGIIGEGGMGAVYRAKQKSLKRRVAIKVLPPNLGADPRLLQRFHLEAQTASKLVSPHIVQVYFIGEHEGNHFYAMEFVDGTDLYDVIKKSRDDNKPLTPDEACNFIVQAAKGLSEAGRHGVVHRDIKPPNMMVTKDGLVKIADFGIVKVLGEHNLTLTGQAVGTPAYVSPEQGRGDREVDTRSDLYSLGVVFYELACGKKPFEGTTPNALIYQHCYDEPVLPKNVVSGISDEIQAVILRCLQKKPENRYQTADELVRDLEAIRTGSLLKSAIANYKLGTGADEAKREQMNFFQRHLLPIAAAMLLVVVGGGAGGYMWLTKRGEKELAAMERRSQAETKVSNLRGTLSQSLDNVAPLPDEVEAKIDELANLAPDGSQDADVIKWRQKVDEVRILETRLAQVDAGKLDLAARQRARKDLESYAGKVGSGDVAGTRWSKRLADLDAEESRLRAAGTSFDAIQLKKGDRDRFAAILASLAVLVPADDPQLSKWNARVSNWDGELAKLRGRLAPLDQKASITERERVVYANALADLKGYLDENDGEFRRWNDKLEAARGRIGLLREQIRSVVGDAPDLISKPKHDQIADKLTQYRTAMGDEDSYAKDWLAAIEAADKTIEGCRGRLREEVKQAGDPLLPAGVLGAFERDLNQLTALARPGDAEAIAWDQQLRDSRRTLEELRAELRVLEPSETRTVSLAAQTDLGSKLTRLSAKGGIEPERADVYRQRLAAEGRRIAALRISLADFDKVDPITQPMRLGLKQLIDDIGGEDKDALRWSAKLAKVDDLCLRIGAIDRKEPVPEDLDRLFTALEQLVGANDPQLVSWRGKVLRINEARSSLAVLDKRQPFDAAAIDAGLGTLSELVGASDRAYVRWRGKADAVRQLKAELARLPATLAQDPAAQAASHGRLRRLVSELVGSDDADVRAAARRQQELDGPGRPSWAVDGGRDAYGLWVVADLPGGRARLRYVPPAHVRVGSPDGEAGRDSDELQVELILPRAFWIAETEMTQAVYNAVAGRDPSRFPGREATLQPVERVTWDEAKAYCVAVSGRLPGFAARLPLEAEWELAARAGSTAPWSLPAGLRSDADGVSKIAWSKDNAGATPRPVRARLPNALGLYDMAGNVAEWVADTYGPWPTSTVEVTAPAAGGELRVLRGGSWGDSWVKTRSANRIPVRADLRTAYAGFRLAADVDWGGAEPDGAAVIADAQRGMAAKQHEFSIGGWRLKIEPEDGR